jgi:hypothetical protein
MEKNKKKKNQAVQTPKGSQSLNALATTAQDTQQAESGSNDISSVINPGNDVPPSVQQRQSASMIGNAGFGQLPPSDFTGQSEDTTAAASIQLLEGDQDMIDWDDDENELGNSIYGTVDDEQQAHTTTAHPTTPAPPTTTIIVARPEERVTNTTGTSGEGTLVHPPAPTPVGRGPAIRKEDAQCGSCLHMGH